MPHIPVVPTICRFAMHSTISGGHRITNVIDVSIDSSIAGTREDSVNQAGPFIVAHWQSRIIAPGANTVNFTGCTFVDLHSVDGHTGSIPPQSGQPVTGTDGSTQASPQVAYLIHKNSTTRRGARQGRLYHGPVAEGNVDAAGVVSSAAMGALDSRFNGFRNDIGTHTDTAIESMAWRIVHVHKPSADPDTWTYDSSTIDACVTDSQCATVRRRNRG